MASLYKGGGWGALELHFTDKKVVVICFFHQNGVTWESKTERFILFKGQKYENDLIITSNLETMRNLVLVLRL